MKKVPIVEESSIALVRNVLRVGPLQHGLELVKKYGDIVNLKFPKNFYGVAHPVYAKHIYHSNASNYFKKPTLQHKLTQEWLGESILLTNNYELWKKDRGIIELSLYKSQFKDYAPQVVQNSLNMLDHFNVAADTRTPINLNLYFAEIAIHNLITTIFKNVDLDYKKFSAHIHEMLILITRRVWSMTDLKWRLPTQERKRWRQALKAMDEVVLAVINDRLQQQTLGDDVLGHLLNAYINEPDQNKAMKQVRDEVMVLLFAGHDTIATTLTWCVAILSLNPEVERRVRHEIDTVVNGRLPTYDDIQSLHYTQAVMSETLRLYPVVPYVLREAAEDDEINGYYIPKGVQLNVAIYMIHRHPDFWPNPQAYDPERFVKNPWYQHQNFAFIPGTAGERHCVGIQFALMEGCLALVMMLQRYRLTLPFGAQVTPKKVSTFLEPETVMMNVDRVKI